MSRVAPRSIDIESIDLAKLTQRLAARVPGGARVGTLVGRTAFRDATQGVLGCSALQAETLVDTLIARGFLVLVPGSADDNRDRWETRPHAT